MQLSNLQKYIILECFSANHKVGGGRISRGRLTGFYDRISIRTDGSSTGGIKKPKKEVWTKIITKSIERLIDKEFLIGFGERTKYKWFIKEIRLTAQGRKVAKRLLGEQMKLPLK